MKLNANHSLFLWKTLLTKSAVAGFQLWVSSLATFCLANRRFSLLWDEEVDVYWLVLVLGCQLITCSDVRQGSRSSPSTVSDAVVWCRFRYSVCKDLNGVVRLSGTGWSKFVGKFFIFMTRQPGAYTLTVTRHFEKLCVIGTGAPTIWSSAVVQKLLIRGEYYYRRMRSMSVLWMILPIGFTQSLKWTKDSNAWRSVAAVRCSWLKVRTMVGHNIVMLVSTFSAIYMMPCECDVDMCTS